MVSNKTRPQRTEKILQGGVFYHHLTVKKGMLRKRLKLGGGQA
jgi:hypothetical protein